MSKKLSISLMIALIISLFAIRPALAAKTYRAERFDVQVDIQEDGSALVTETIEFRFEGGDFTYAFREVSATNTDSITFLDASMDGASLPQGTLSGQVEVEAGNPLKVTWHFPAASDAAHVFTLRYRADGVIRKGNADAIIWRAIPEDHDYSIANSTITLIYPRGATLLEEPTLSRNFESTSEAGRIILTSSGLANDEDLVLTAKFTPGSLTQAMPQWQSRSEQTARAVPVGLIAGVAALFFGGLGLFSYIRTNKRELNISAAVITSTPPADISPAIVGKLTGQAYAFMGTIFDLAQRGALEVREEKGYWGAKNHMITRKENNISFEAYEQGLLNALFKPGETQVNMNEIATRIGTKSKLFDEPLEQELIRHGWLDVERKQKRTTLAATGFISMIIAMLAFIANAIGMNAISNVSWPSMMFAGLAGICAAVFVLSIPLLIYAGMFSVLTPAGEEQKARWLGFAEYLKQVSKGKESAIRPDTFEIYLAYAAVFGLGTNWAKYFQELGGVPLPIWFHAMAGSDGDFGAMVAVMSASDSAGASGSDGGGGGASGGGSSGAG